MVREVFITLERRARIKTISKMHLFINGADLLLQIFNEEVFDHLANQCPNDEEINQNRRELDQRINHRGLVVAIAILCHEFKVNLCLKHDVCIVSIWTLSQLKILPRKIEVKIRGFISISTYKLLCQLMNFVSHLTF